MILIRVYHVCQVYSSTLVVRDTLKSVEYFTKACSDIIHKLKSIKHC